ncbi:hypothetical protein, partial [Mesorhizobium sp.]|uniref:hypothetical protein n=1 Tax=Mesorhizobium sp. TaxID=1871066 RepID=UPI00257C227E
RGDQTIAEALDVIGSRTVPVLVAVGDGAEFGVGAWAKAPSVLPVVATTSGGAAILDNSARPERNQTPWRTVLYADGAPVAGEEQLSQGKACGDGAHLTANQMLHPETARIVQPGGSSFATFKATASLCYVHQYTELLRVLLRARTPIGLVEVEPFVAYYVDSPVNRACPALAHRWADQRKQFGAPQYWIEASDKSRLDEFVNGNSIELRPNYSIPLVKAFLNHLPEHRMTDSEANERYVSSKTLLAMLRRFHLTDLIEVAANSGNVRYAEWKQLAAKDGTPAVREQLVDAIESYCGNQSLFLVLSDKAEPFFDLME